MGLCLCSKRKRCDVEEAENRFKVINVNDDGRKICPGVMELTETCLVLHLEKGGFVKWPYICLVKYGYNSNLFSFVCGRRCQTGEGIFGFKCSRAEELFNKLQDSMQNNRISIISDTDSDSPTCAEQTLPYRYETYPSFPASSYVLSSSSRPEPIGGEIIPDVISPQTSEQDDRVRLGCDHKPLEKQTSDGGVSQASSTRSYLEMSWEYQGSRAYQKPLFVFRNKEEKAEVDVLHSINSNVDLNHAICDTGYDSDDRREASCIRRMGYENIGALQSERFRSRSMVVSVSSSSDSQNTNYISTRTALCGFDSQPSSPSVFEEKYSLEQRASPSKEAMRLCHNRLSLGQDSLNRQDCVATYFNFDMKQQTQDYRKLNYIQVEMESGCDSDNPQTPQSPDTTSVSWTTNLQCELYAELDLEKTVALSRIHRHRPKDDGTRKTRHNSKHFPM
ncbi:fibroblast growth factor receptor substrate 2-like [Spea bombifrons]|uniref:fibroblast growth factor receptor substrate 2-like n=1 Tax=Spea bombifrons TaxID=233779 RepID=UPI00234B3BAC|nr:fibroblast growth factor receptor substrate 2-like [Spea bombifrons]